MYCEKNGREYALRIGYQENDTLRGSLNRLAGETFGGLSFEEWYRMGLWSDQTIPYTLFDGERAVSNVLASVFETRLFGRAVRCVQLGAVMTAPRERGLGLSRFLIERAVGDWSSTDSILYLYANDSVTAYYPRFGFRQETEYRFCTSVTPGRPARLRRLDLRDAQDRALFLRCCEEGNPFTALPALGCPGIAVFNALYCYGENVFWAEDFGAALVAVREGRTLTLPEVFGGLGRSLGELLSAIAGPGADTAVLGFTPAQPEDFQAEVYVEEDTAFFVHGKGRNPFREERLLFPVLSHT